MDSCSGGHTWWTAELKVHTNGVITWQVKSDQWCCWTAHDSSWDLPCSGLARTIKPAKQPSSQRARRRPGQAARRRRPIGGPSLLLSAPLLSRLEKWLPKGRGLSPPSLLLPQTRSLLSVEPRWSDRHRWIGWWKLVVQSERVQCNKIQHKETESAAWYCALLVFCHFRGSSSSWVLFEVYSFFSSLKGRSGTDIGKVFS